MIKHLSSKDSEQYKNLRLLSLKSDPESFLSTLDAEMNRDLEYFAAKIMYASSPPIFGYYGFFENDELIGTIQLSNNNLTKTKHFCNIYELYVHPDHRHKKIATRLIDHVIKKVRSINEIEFVRLYVNSNNTASIALYKKYGFEQITSIPQAVREKDGSYQDELVFSYVVK